jgi:hypothetical protein
MNATDLNEAVDIESLTADAMAALIEAHDIVLVISDADGIHTIEYDEDVDELTFYAHGSAGYDADGTRAALETALDSEDVGITFADNRPEPTHDDQGVAADGGAR